MDDPNTQYSDAGVPTSSELLALGRIVVDGYVPGRHNDRSRVDRVDREGDLVRSRLPTEDRFKTN